MMSSQELSPLFLTGFARGKNVIAVDADDVLVSTNKKVAELYNELYDLDPPMQLDDFKHYLYWLNRGWGTPAETAQKITELYNYGLLDKAEPLPGALEGLRALKNLGFRLVLITARGEAQRAGTEDWLRKYLPDLFERHFFTGAFTSMQGASAADTQPKRKQSKAEIAHNVGACLLIDDSLENALNCASHDPPLPVLLFGHYPWNSHISPEDSSRDGQASKERVYRGIDTLQGEDLANRLLEDGQTLGRLHLPDTISRVKDWQEVVGFVTNMTGSNEV